MYNWTNLPPGNCVRSTSGSPELGFIQTQNCVSALSDKLEEKYVSLSSNVSELSIQKLLLDRTVQQPFVFLYLYFYYLVSDSSTADNSTKLETEIVRYSRHDEVSKLLTVFQTLGAEIISRERTMSCTAKNSTIHVCGSMLIIFSTNNGSTPSFFPTL